MPAQETASADTPGRGAVWPQGCGSQEGLPPASWVAPRGVRAGREGRKVAREKPSLHRADCLGRNQGAVGGSWGKSGDMSAGPGSVDSISRPTAAAVPGVGLTRAAAAGPTFTELVRAETAPSPHLGTERGGGPHGRSEGPIFGPGRGSPGVSGPSSPVPAPPDPVPRVWAGRGPGGTMSHQRRGELILIKGFGSSLSVSLFWLAPCRRACAPRGGLCAVRTGSRG